MIRRDYLGNELEIGDDIVFVLPGALPELARGTVTILGRRWAVIQPWAREDTLTQYYDKIIKVL